MADTEYPIIGPVYTETANGHVFTSENRQYGPKRWRTIYRMDGKLIAHSDWSRHRRVHRHLEDKARRIAAQTTTSEA